MRSGDVRQRAAVRTKRRDVVGVVAVVRAEVDARVRLGHRIEERGFRFGVGLARPVLGQVAGGRLEQHAAADRRPIRERLEVIRVHALQLRRIGLRGAAQVPQVRLARREVVVRRQLVARRHLPRQPHVVADVRLAVGARSREIRLIDEIEGIRLVIGVGAENLVAPVPMRRPEPHLVAFDRTAEREARVVEMIDRIGRRHALRLEIGRQVVRLPVVRRVVEERGSAEGVAAFLRNDVHTNAAAARFG